MTEITKEYLLEHGFTSDRPDDALCRFVKSPEDNSYRIMVEHIFRSLDTNLTWAIDCWNCDEHGAIVRRANVMYTDSVEDLETVIKLTNIDYD
jgi:hypothetical protein